MNEEIKRLIKEKKFTQVHELLLPLNVVDIAQLMEALDIVDLFILFRILPKERAASVFAYLNSDMQQKVVEAMSDKEVGYLINELFTDDAVDFIEEMPASVVKKVLSNANEQTRKIINQFLQYPEDSAGSIMTNEFVDLKASMTVQQAFERIRKIGLDKETVYTCFVMDDNRILEGIVTVRKLLLASPTEVVQTIMNSNPIKVHTLDDQEKVASMFRKYDLLSMPVVDKEQRLVGLITIDDVIDVIQEENTEDIEKMAALIPSDDTYLRTPTWKHAIRRLPWLIILMFSAAFTGWVLKIYESALAAQIVLVTFIPMLMDTGGNSGQQAATLVIRGIALDEIKVQDWLKVVFKELKVSLLVATVLSLTNLLRIWLFGGDLQIALVVAVSLFTTVILAKFAGGLLPIISKALHLDPALVAAPLITTIVDAGAMIVYFSIAKFLLKL